MKLFIMVTLFIAKSWATEGVTAKWEFSEDKSTKRAVEVSIGQEVFKVDGEWRNSDDKLEVKMVDLNDDKENDYAITIKRGVSNRYILYVIRHKEMKKYISLGIRPELSRSNGDTCWTGIEKGSNTNRVTSLSVQGDRFVTCVED